MRDTTWDEEDTTSEAPLLPGELGSQISGPEAMSEYVQRIYREGVSKQILALCEDRKPINKVVDDVPPIRQDGQTLIVPVVVEKMVLVKKTILLEEIILCPKEEADDVDDEDCDC